MSISRVLAFWKKFGAACTALALCCALCFIRILLFTSHVPSFFGVLTLIVVACFVRHDHRIEVGDLRFITVSN